MEALDDLRAFGIIVPHVPDDINLETADSPDSHNRSKSRIRQQHPPPLAPPLADEEQGSFIDLSAGLSRIIGANEQYRWDLIVEYSMRREDTQRHCEQIVETRTATTREATLRTIHED